MARYMVVYQSKEGTSASFFELIGLAENFRMTCVCCMGWEAEVYERTAGEGGWEYKLIYA